MYETNEIKDIKNNHRVQMSFVLACPDWCKFEKSNVFRLLVEYLEEIGKEKR